MASEKHCEMFVRNLLGGESQKCFNCGMHQEAHKNHALIVSDDDVKNPQQQQAANPEQQQRPDDNEYSGSDSEELANPKQQGRPTIFNEEQRRRMIAFGRELGWSLWPHRSNPSVPTFCDSIGITRKQFRGWLHTNKHKYIDGNN